MIKKKTTSFSSPYPHDDDVVDTTPPAEEEGLSLETVFSEVIHRRLYFGGYPSKYHMVQWRRRVRGWGGNRMILVDLTTSNEKTDHRLNSYNNNTNKDGGVEMVMVEHYSFPIQDNQAPECNEEFCTFLSWLCEFFYTNTETNNPLIIHCKGGHGRSAMVMVGMLYLLMMKKRKTAKSRPVLPVKTFQKTMLDLDMHADMHEDMHADMHVDMHDLMNIITQIHHLRKNLHRKYLRQLCPISSQQRIFLCNIKKSLDQDYEKDQYQSSRKTAWMRTTTKTAGPIGPSLPLLSS
jgi:hypothetical protein